MADDSENKIMDLVTYSVPAIEYGSERWEKTVQAHLDLGKTREEAEFFVNVLLTDRGTIPAHIHVPEFTYAGEYEAIDNGDGTYSMGKLIRTLPI